MNPAVSVRDSGMKLNPFYEIVRDLNLCEPHDYQDYRFCYRPQISRLATRRPEFRPFLDLILSNAPSGHPLSQYTIRDSCRKLFGFAIPTPAAVQMVAQLGSIVEIGAGTGYWASLLVGAGAHVEAFDNFTWKLPRLWFNVKRGGAPAAGRSMARALMLCWPPYDTSMAFKALSVFRGDTLVYVGEGHGGCTADDRFHDALEEGWVQETVAPSLRWPGLHDRVGIWKRRDAAPLLHIVRES